eukprot:m.22648 g.22648  ORF g.22648 m.22648 type:complete len:638 (-) comp3783_c0_seq1:227-2140(-)
MAGRGASSVHYKFMNSPGQSYETITFDGPYISLGQLKGMIFTRLGTSTPDCDLRVIDAQTKKVYDGDQTFIPKNTSVTVARIPLQPGSVITFKRPEQAAPTRPVEAPPPTTGGDTEEERLANMMKNAAAGAPQPDNRKTMQKKASDVICHRCNQTGHRRNECPLNEVRKALGIPKHRLEYVSADTPNAVLASDGRYAIIKQPIAAEVMRSSASTQPVPPELLCPMCNKLFSEAVIIPCCGKSYCDSCIRPKLLDDSLQTGAIGGTCPAPDCGRTDVSPDALIPNQQLRASVLAFRGKHDATLPAAARAPAGTSNGAPAAAAPPQPAPASSAPPTEAPSGPAAGAGGSPTSDLEANAPDAGADDDHEMEDDSERQDRSDRPDRPDRPEKSERQERRRAGRGNRRYNNQNQANTLGNNPPAMPAMPGPFPFGLPPGPMLPGMMPGMLPGGPFMRPGMGPLPPGMPPGMLPGMGPPLGALPPGMLPMRAGMPPIGMPPMGLAMGPGGAHMMFPPEGFGPRPGMLSKDEFERLHARRRSRSRSPRRHRSRSRSPRRSRSRSPRKSRSRSKSPRRSRSPRKHKSSHRRRSSKSKKDRKDRDRDRDRRHKDKSSPHGAEPAGPASDEGSDHDAPDSPAEAGTA